MNTEENDCLETRTSLLEKLKDSQNHEAWGRFFNTYWRLIYSAARRAGLKKEDADEVVQETVIGVARKLPEFRYDRHRGSFKTWLLTLTRWRILDCLRRQQRRSFVESDSDKVERCLASSEFDHLWNEEWKSHLIEAAAAQLRDAIEPKHYLAFELTVIKEWDLRDAARALGISMARLYVIRHRVKREFRKAISMAEKGFVNETS